MSLLQSPVPILFALALAPGAPAGGGALTDMLKTRQAKLDAIVARFSGELPQPEKRRLADALSEIIDYREMAKDALGAEWDRRTEAERGEFVQSFDALLRASMVRRTDVYRVESIRYLREEVEGGAGRVATSVRFKEATTEVEYAFRLVGGRWRAVDYKIDGVSTVRNYRSQFAKILRDTGWSALLNRVRKRAADLEEGR